jgi:ketosteroid isomerase-like protein
MTVVFIYRIAGDKIAEVWRAADGLSSYQQIGAQIIMPGTNVDVVQPTSLPGRPEKAAEQKSSSEQKTSQSNKAVDNKNTADRETPSEGTTEGNKALVARWADAIWNKDLAVAETLVTDDCVVHAGGSTYSRGPAGIRQWLADVDSNWNYGGSMTDDIIAEGDKVARRTTVFAGYKPNRRGTVTSVVFLYRMLTAKSPKYGVWRITSKPTLRQVHRSSCQAQTHRVSRRPRLRRRF